MIVRIDKVTPKSFETDEGETIDYFWYKAYRPETEVTFQFGSKNGEHEVGKELDINIEKSESVNKKGVVVFRYKEVED